MSRKIIPVNAMILNEIIQDLESKKSYNNRSELYKDIAAEYCQKQNTDKVTPSVIYLRCKQWDLKMNTPIGKRGRVGGIPFNTTRIRTSRAEKFSQNSVLANAIKKIDFITPIQYKPVVKRIKNGSMKAAIQLKCLDCSDFQSTEVRNCECVECPLWVFRPYKK